MAAEAKWKRWRFLTPLLAVLPSAVWGADISPEMLKARYILNMPKFITVGNPPHGPRKFCYYEKRGVPLDESVGQQIEKYASTQSDAMLSVKKFEAIRDLSGCDIFYISAEEEANIDNILAVLDGASTLTISDAQRFALRGGMIGFVEDENNRIKMEANQKNAEEKNVHIDAQLLELMLHVFHQ